MSKPVEAVPAEPAVKVVVVQPPGGKHDFGPSCKLHARVQEAFGAVERGVQNRTFDMDADF